jgi:transposase InsO family protein
MMTVYLVTWDQTKPELGYNNPGFGQECDQMYNYTVILVKNAETVYPGANMKPAPQEAMNTATHFSARCQVDLIGPFPLSANKNVHLIVMIDAFSSYDECVPTPNKEAATIYQTFLSDWVAQHSLCDRLNSDLESEFHNGLFKELSAKIGLKHTFSSVAHPTSNGQVERANGSILTYMRKFITENGQWESMLPALKFALNSAPHATKRYSLFQIYVYVYVYVRRPNLAHMLHTPTHSYSEEEAVQILVHMNRITQDVCKWKDEAFICQKKEFDNKYHTRTFDTGDIIYVTRPHSGHLAQNI